MPQNIRIVKEDALATINAALTILQRFPDLESSNFSYSINTSTNPFQFLMDAFKSIIGYDRLIQIIAKFISWQIPLVETTVKTLLITKLKDIISCSVNPFLTDDLLRNGISFNINEIDLIDIFKYSPFDEKVGYLYYYQTNWLTYDDGWEPMIDDEDYEPKNNMPGEPDDCIISDDMNCLLWFMINRANKRYVWKPFKYRNDKEFRKDYPTDPDVKLEKKDGIVTFDFNERSANLKDAYGNDYKTQTPYNNILHVFIGDVREKSDHPLMIQLANYEDVITNKEKEIDIFTKKIETLSKKLEDIKKEKENCEKSFANGEFNDILNEDGTVKKTAKKQYEEKIKKYNIQIEIKEIEITGAKDLREKYFREKNKVQNQISDIKSQIKSFGDVYFPFNGQNNRNYYYGKTLIQFNIDYIMSLSLFEAKSLTARLIDSITGILTIDLNLSYKQQLIKNEVSKMVEMIIENDDIVIPDCFFTFTNDDYDAMNRKAELRKAGLFTINGDETSAVKINAESILSDLNKLNSTANQEKIQSVIEGTLTNISKQLSNTEYELNDKLNYGVQMNFIENILNGLSYALVMSILSPKVYLLLLINLKIVGRESNFNLEEFIGKYKQLIADLIRSIRDQILEFLQKELMNLISDLVSEVTLRLGIEQARYYARLLKQLIDCFKQRTKNLRYNNEIDFNIDDVDYADIYDNNEEPPNNEC